MFQLAEDLGCGRFIMSEVKQPNVRRCLFGRPDPIKLANGLNTQEKLVEDESAAKFKELWGLDPASGQPYEGGLYECVEVDTKRENIPSFYTKGYAPRKSRPVCRAMREKSPGTGIFPYLLQSGRPLSAKRKLDLDDHEYDENDENRAISNESRVPVKGEIVGNTLSSSSPTLLDSPDCRLCEPTDSSFSCQGLSRSSSTSSLSELSPRIVEMITPPTRAKLTQSSIKDFLPLKKQCVISSKNLPRT